MTANEVIRPVAGAVFGKLRALRTARDGRFAVCFCICQRTVTVEIDDLIAGVVAACPRCSTETRSMDRQP